MIWRSGSQFAAQLVQWASTFLVIRLLAPSDYGLFAMTGVVLALFNMLNGYGLASALVQRPRVSEREIRQLFGMLIVVNACLALAQLAIAPLAAAYYRQPEVAALLRVQAVIYATTPFTALSGALLARAMDYRAQAKANIVASLAGAATALVGALAGWGVWTLVAAPVVLFAIRATGFTLAAGAVRPSFDFRGAGGLARYGGMMAAGQLFWFLQSQADVFIAGRWFSAHQIGIYTTALFLTQIFVAKLVPPLNEVAFAAYARIQHDRTASAAAFLKGARIVMLAALPFYLGLAATAEPLVLTMLGDKWREAVQVVRLLALAMPFMTLQVLFSPACDAIGRPDVGVRNGAAGAAILALCFAVAVPWGPTGLALAWIAGYPLYLVSSCRRTLPVLGVGAPALAGAVMPPLLAASAMALVVTLADRLAAPALADLPRLAVLVVLGGAVYVGWLAAFARQRLSELLVLLRR